MEKMSRSFVSKACGLVCDPFRSHKTDNSTCMHLQVVKEKTIVKKTLVKKLWNAVEITQ